MTDPTTKAERLKAAWAERDKAHRAWVEAERARDEADRTWVEAERAWNEARRKFRAIDEEQ